MGMPETIKNKLRAPDEKPNAPALDPNGKKGKSPIPVTMAGLDSHKITGVLKLYEPMFATALMGAIPPERMIQVTTSIIAENDALKACSTKSIIGAVLSASIIGLDPTPELGLVYFIPRKSKCCLEIGYMGWLNLMYRNPNISHIYAYCVRENDQFEVRLGLEPRIDHVPNLDKPGPLKYVYAVAQLSNGQQVFRYLNQDQVEARRNRSEAKDSKYSPWNDKVLVEEMWGKTAIKVLRKFVPITLESRVATAMAVDGQSVMPEAIDLDKKTVKVTESDISEATVINETQTANGSTPKTNGQTEPPPNEPPNAEKSAHRERFLKALEVHRKRITELKGESYWKDLPGRFGYESFEEVEEAGEEQCLIDLSAISRDLQKAAAQNGGKTEQGSLL